MSESQPLEPEESEPDDPLVQEAPDPPQVVVGIGASAGGLAALQQFFAHMPPDRGMVFVVIVHLSPNHASTLAEILQASTTMPVVQVTAPVQVSANHVYVIPPAQHLSLRDGSLHLSEPERPRGRRVPIDLFFRTLADAYGRNAAAVVLSGAGADGALGLMRVKEFGGVALVQDPDEAEYDGMPRAAIATGMADFVLPAAQLPTKLVAYWQRADAAALPPDDLLRPGTKEDALREVLLLLRARTGHDFSNYKRATLLRRIGRRLQVNGLGDVTLYPGLLRDQPGEIQALLRDLLISVTNFFRDPDAFAALEAALPALFAEKEAGDQVRVWVVGCASGEEAYSVAMLLREYAERLENPPAIQIFATDIDEQAITKARDGLYLDTIANDLSPERLVRFFSVEQGRYRIKKEIRDMVLFAVHNVLRDPPFSRLDLITCRNVLIYLNRQVQEQVLSLFHFALRPDGRLFLGNSESTDGVPSLFSPLDKQHRLFTRRTAVSPTSSLPTLLTTLATRGPTVEPLTASKEQQRSLGALFQQLLAPYAPASVLINDSYDIVQLSPRATRWLQFQGTPSFNLLNAIHPLLRLELRTALFAARKENRSELRRVRLVIESVAHLLTMRVEPLQQPEWARGLILIVIEEVLDVVDGDEALVVPDSADPLARELEEENRRLKEQLRATIEQYETSLEELKASNEELQAMNEEFRATTEELETSKEELQSVNEELVTVNNELKNKVDELGRVNSDLNNLLVATDIGTIFLDRELRIKRYTPRVQDLFNIIPADLGRPLAHVTHRFAYGGLADDAAQVLQRLAMLEREVRNSEGRWFMVRLLPYRTVEDRIDGVVLTFIEISARRQAEEALRQGDERFRLMYEYVRDYAIFSIDTQRRVQDWNSGAEHLFGFASAEIIGQSVDLLYTDQDRANDVPAQELATAAATGRAEDERWHRRRSGAQFYMSGVVTALYDSDGQVRGFLKIGRDSTDRKRADEQRQHAYDSLEEQVAEHSVTLAMSRRALEGEIVGRQDAERGREQVLRRLMTAQEEERRRIARDLHDQLGQQLTSLSLQLTGLDAALGTNEAARGRLQLTQGLVGTISQELHQLAFRLRPAALDDLGLEAALDNLVEEWSRQTGVPIELQSRLNGQRIGPQIATAAYRVTQEALSNVVRHAKAQQVSLILERRAAELVLIVEDDGVGFDVDAMQAKPVQQRLGLLGMEERVLIVGGTLVVESTPGQGTTVLVRLPLPQLTEEEPHG